MAALFASPSLFADLIVNGLLIGGLYAIIAMGLNLQYGMLRILNIAHGEFLMIGAFITYTLKVATGASPLWFLPVSAAAMFALGLLLHATIFRRLSAISPNLDVMEEKSLIVGFGLLFILQSAAVLIWGADLHGYDFMTDSLRFGGVIFTANRLLVLLLAILFSAGLILGLRFTLLGRAIRGMVQAPLGAMLVGINTRTLHPLCFGLGLVRRRSSPNCSKSSATSMRPERPFCWSNRMSARRCGSPATATYWSGVRSRPKARANVCCSQTLSGSPIWARSDSAWSDWKVLYY